MSNLSTLQIVAALVAVRGLDQSSVRRIYSFDVIFDNGDTDLENIKTKM